MMSYTVSTSCTAHTLAHTTIKVAHISCTVYTLDINAKGTVCSLIAYMTTVAHRANCSYH